MMRVRFPYSARLVIVKMGFTTICVTVAVAIFTLYNFAVLGLFNVPESLSNSYYLFKERKEWQKCLFPIMMVSLVVLLLPAWLTLSEGSTFQFMTFLTCAGILFTGAAPAFKSGGVESRVHKTSAIVAAIFAILWIVLVTEFEFVIGMYLVGVTAMALLTRTLKTCYVYHLELVAFLSTCTVLLLCL